MCRALASVGLSVLALVECALRALALLLGLSVLASVLASVVASVSAQSPCTSTPKQKVAEGKG